MEKNPNAIVTLLTQKEETWGDSVDVISSDMRLWKPEEKDKADIIVSELLGSFGDNELSPECLYSAQHLFKPDAISIPCSYTSWVKLTQHFSKNDLNPFPIISGRAYSIVKVVQRGPRIERR